MAPLRALPLICLLGLFGARVHADLWSTAYYAGWMQGYLPASNIDLKAVSDLIHFSVIPNADGTLNSTANSLTPAYSAEVVTRVHAAGKAALICVGGADTQTGFEGAASSANLAKFINNLTNFMASRSYDGIDVDWEPLPASDNQKYTNLVNGLRSALNTFPQHKLLTAAVGAYPPYGDPPQAEYAMFATLQNQFDQINIMTYDLSGPWDGWVTWFNAPIYDGGYRFPSTGGLVPSAEGAVSNFVAAGVAPGKLGIGIAFYGYVWTAGAGTSTGGTVLPRQTWTTAPTVTAVNYFAIIPNYYQSNRYHWDPNAQAAYLSITNTPATNDIFLSYDDEHTCQVKISYARNRGLGGVMIWELGSGYLASQPSGQRDLLLQSVRQALATPRLTNITASGGDIHLGFTSLPLALYRVLWTSNPASGNWTTLTNNVAGSNGALQIMDAGTTTNTKQRYYRVQTPP